MKPQFLNLPIRTATAVALVLYVSTACAEEKRNPMWQMFQHHYAQRVQNFRTENNSLMNVVLLGDSLTEGFDVTTHFPLRRVLNRGIGADIIGKGKAEDDRRGVLQRLGPSVFDTGTSHVFLLIGVNDLGDSRPLDVMEEGYREILATIKEKTPLVTVHVQSLLPTRGAFARHNENIVRFNERLRALAREFGYPYVDLHSLFADEKGELREELTNDGLHLKPEAYRIWKEAIEKEMGWAPAESPEPAAPPHS